MEFKVALNFLLKLCLLSFALLKLLTQEGYLETVKLIPSFSLLKEHAVQVLLVLGETFSFDLFVSLVFQLLRDIAKCRLHLLNKATQLIIVLFV